jgi:hypothetical protein
MLYEPCLSGFVGLYGFSGYVVVGNPDGAGGVGIGSSEVERDGMDLRRL